jgi:hypothetical protein
MPFNATPVGTGDNLKALFFNFTPRNLLILQQDVPLKIRFPCVRKEIKKERKKKKKERKKERNNVYLSSSGYTVYMIIRRAH